jgi:hypothetical protein
MREQRAASLNDASGHARLHDSVDDRGAALQVYARDCLRRVQPDRASSVAIELCRVGFTLILAGAIAVFIPYLYPRGSISI